MSSTALVYDPTSGSYMSPGDIGSLDQSALDAGIAAQTALDAGPSPVPAPVSTPIVATSGSGGSSTGSLSGLAGIFGAIGTSIAATVRQVNTPTTVAPGTLVYNPATGQYVQAGLTGAMNPNAMIIVVVVIGIAALFLLRHKG